MNIIDKIMNALSLYDEEEIIEEEVEQKPAKTEQEPAKPKKRFFGSKEPASPAPAEEPKRERKSILNFKGSAAKPEPGVFVFRRPPEPHRDGSIDVKKIIKQYKIWLV